MSGRSPQLPWLSVIVRVPVRWSGAAEKQKKRECEETSLMGLDFDSETTLARATARGAEVCVWKVRDRSTTLVFVVHQNTGGSGNWGHRGKLDPAAFTPNLHRTLCHRNLQCYSFLQPPHPWESSHFNTKKEAMPLAFCFNIKDKSRASKTTESSLVIVWLYLSHWNNIHPICRSILIVWENWASLTSTRVADMRSPPDCFPGNSA